MKQRSTLWYAIIGMAILAGAIMIAATYNGAQKPQELRQKAATPTGTERIILSPASTSFTSGTPVSIALSGAFSDTKLDGIQVIATISGTIPNNVQFTPATIPGLQIAISTLIQSGPNYTLQLVYATLNNPLTPYAATTTQALGSLTFTAPPSGTLQITYDTTLTKMSQNTTTTDILAIPNNEIYTFVEPTPTPTNTPKPTSTPIPTPTSTPTPMPTNTPIPTATPIPTSTPTPTPIACNRADIDKNGTVNGADITLLRSVFWQSPPTIIRADINGDGIVDLTDYSILVASYNSSTGACQ